MIVISYAETRERLLDQKLDAVLAGAWYWSKFDLKGVLFSTEVLVLSFAFGSYRSSSSVSCFFLPQSLHAVYARAPSRIAPPTPPTTPPMMDLELELRPELPDPLLSPLTLATPVDVTLAVDVTGTKLLVVTA